MSAPAHPIARRALLALAGSGWLLPAAAAAESGTSGPAAFDAAVRRQPWLLPFKGVGDAELRCESLVIHGRWPRGLQGRFYRNGPALFERGGQRYRHWFDGDGMVQQFSIAEGRVAHRGRLVRTHKLAAEQAAGRFLVPAYGTPVESGEPLRGPDSINVANTNAIEHAGRVLAMWEAGSAWALDPQDLATRGPVTWRAGLEQMPFSAHPKVDAGGHLWNVGGWNDRLVVWHVDPAGRLVDATLVPSPYPGGMVHDMSVTASYVVVPLPPVKMHFARPDPAGAATWEPEQPLRVLVLRKDDPTRQRVFELPAQMVFHIGNTHEERDGTLVMSYVASSDHGFLVDGAFALMRGEPNRAADPGTWIARLDPRSGRAVTESLGDIAEFPRVHPRLVGRRARYLASGATWRRHPGRDVGLLHGVQLVDLDSGRVDRHDYGADAVAEEHVLVPRPGGRGERDGWLLGTTFDARRGVTLLNVLDAARVADGPIAQAALPYALPLGFHGNFSAR